MAGNAKVSINFRHLGGWSLNLVLMLGLPEGRGSSCSDSYTGTTVRRGKLTQMSQGKRCHRKDSSQWGPKLVSITRCVTPRPLAVWFPLLQRSEWAAGMLWQRVPEALAGSVWVSRWLLD